MLSGPGKGRGSILHCALLRCLPGWF